MKIVKKGRLILSLCIILLSVLITAKLIDAEKIKASGESYSLEIVDSNYKDTGYLQVKLTAPNLEKERLNLSFSGVSGYDIEHLVDGLNEADQKKVSITANEANLLEDLQLDFSGNGEVFSTVFVVLPDNQSELETGLVELKSSDGVVLSSVSFETRDKEEEEEMEVSPAVVEELSLVEEQLTPASMTSAAAGMISPMAIDLPTPVNAVDVSTWTELQAALTSTTVDWINLKADIDFGAAVTITRSKVINGLNGSTKHKLNFLARAVTLGSASTGSYVALTDMTIQGTSAAAIFTSGTSNSANWELRMDNVNTASGNASALLSGVQSTVIISGESNLGNTGTTAFITAQHLKVTDQANVNVELRRLFFTTAQSNSSVTVDGDSKLTISATDNSNVIQATSVSAFKFDGAGTEVTISGYSSGGAASDAIMLLRSGTSISTIDVTNGAKVNVNSLSTPSGSPAVLMESEGGKFTVSDKSEFHAYGKNTDGGTLAATVRFYSQGGNVFEATNESKISIIRDAGNQSALRMYSNNNGVIVSGGSDFILKSAGDGTARDPGSNGRNQGIQFRNGSRTQTSYFKVLGENSNVSLEAGYGTTIDCDDQLLDVEVTEGAYFVVRGRTASANTGVFSSRRNSTIFNMTKPKYFDFRNDRTGTGGGLIFENLATYGGSDSVFNMVGSDLSVWKGGLDLDGNPSKSWTMINSTWSGANYVNGTSTNADFNLSFEGATAYSRMTANNQTAVIDELRVPTNADKYIWGHAGVPEGKNEGRRDAYTDEVHVRVRVYRSENATDYYEAVGSSIGDSGDDDGISVYGDDPRAGIFKIAVPNGEFLTESHRIEVIGAWRGALEDEGTSIVHTSTASDLQSPERTVLDVTPPEPTALTDENLNNATKVLSGENAQANATVYVYYDAGDSAAGSLLGTTTVGADGKWTFNLPHYVDKTKELSVYLEDHAGKHTAAEIVSEAGAVPTLYDQIGLIKPPATNTENGNINPYNDLAYHDAVFKGVKKYSVADVLPDQPSIEKTASAYRNNVEVVNTQVGDTLLYTLTVKNNKDSSYTTNWKDIVVTDTIPDTVTFDPASAEVTVDGTVVTSPNGYTYDTDTRLLSVNLGDLATQESVVVTFKTKVDYSAAGTEVENTAKAEGDSPRETPFVSGPVDPNADHETYWAESNTAKNPGGIIYGVLELSSAPNKIDFGVKEARSYGEFSAKNPTYDTPLIVSDSRATFTDWTLTATVTEVMTSQNDPSYTLPNALIYKSDNGEEILGLNQAKVILTQHHTASGGYNVSESEWENKDNGFELKLNATQYREMSEYRATILFTLSETP